jgi:hypothetical protein
MKKGIVLSALASTLLLSSVEASQLLDRLEKLESQMAQLQQENQKLKEAVDEDVTSEIEDIGERLDEVEMRSFTDRILFGVGFKSRVESFKRQMADGSTSTDSNIWSTKVMLNMKTEINDNMKFSGRLSMNKYWADSTVHDITSNDSMQGRFPASSSLYVERAYIDWTLNSGSSVPVTLTLGRQPSSDGPSYTYMDDTTRKSTYSALAFDGAADGLVATVNLSKVSGIAGTALRIAYGKGYQNDDTNTMSMNPYVGVSNGIEDTNVLGAFLDTTIPAMPGSLIQLGYVSAKDMIDMPSSPTTIGDMSVAVALIELPNIAKSGLDFFAQYARNTVKPNGQVGVMGGLMTNTASTETQNGDAFWIGARYTLPVKNKPKIGIEYNKGSKYWMAFTNGPHDTYNKLATRGTAIEAYYIQPINKYSFLRAGMVAMDYKYTGSGVHLGTPTEINSALGSSVLDKLTNYYVQFSLLY